MAAKLFLNCELACPSFKCGDIAFNTQLIIAMAKQAIQARRTFLILPELALTGGFLGDLHLSQDLEDQVQHYLQDILLASATWPANFVLIMGTPFYDNWQQFNAALAISKGKIVAKHLAKTLSEEQAKYFKSANEATEDCLLLPIFGPYRPVRLRLLTGLDLLNFAAQYAEHACDVVIDITSHYDAPELQGQIEAARNLLTHTRYLSYLNVNAGPYCSQTAFFTAATYYAAEAELCLAAGNFDFAKSFREFYRADFKDTASALNTAIELSAKQSICVDLLVPRLNALAKKRQALQVTNATNYVEQAISAYFDLQEPRTRLLNVAPYLHQSNQAVRTSAYRGLAALESPLCPSDYYALSWQKLALAVERRLSAAHADAAVLGLSGGLDSTVVLMTTYLSYLLSEREVKNIYAYQLPGLGSSSNSHNHARDLLKILQLEERVIDIKAACLKHFADIEQAPDCYDAAYENAQARERTQILMDKANQVNGLVLGTGDLSEAVLGWCTYNGDHMSMFNPNAGIAKTLMPPLLQAFPQLLEKLKQAEYLSATQKERLAALDLAALAACLTAIMESEISPELLPLASDGQLAQSTAKTIGSYVLHDFCFYHYCDAGYTKADLVALASLAFSAKNIESLKATNLDFSPNSNVYTLVTFTTAEIERVVTIFFKRLSTQQFKRNVHTDGVNLSRYNLANCLHIPSDLHANLWLHQK